MCFTWKSKEVPRVQIYAITSEMQSFSYSAGLSTVVILCVAEG